MGAGVGGQLIESSKRQMSPISEIRLKEQSSGRHGERAETSWRMAKTGNAHLRAALFRMPVVGIQHNPIIKEHYRGNPGQGKVPMNAIGHSMAKSLAIVWGVWRSGQDFDPSKGGPRT